MALLKGAADELAAQGQAAEDDLGLARDAAAFYLKLSESLLRQLPGHLPLASAVAGGFTQYAYGFVAFDADRAESTDSRAALRLRQRAARLYARARDHAMAALEASQPGFARALAYWGAAAWAGQISLSTDRPETVADLPLAIRLARLAYEVDPAHGQGALALLMAQLERARPGGSPRQVEAYFAQAEAAAGAPSAAVLVARAESLAQPAGDRAAFEQLLRRAVDAASAHRDLANQVMRERAQWLLDTADDRF
jgi:hypothetical protein